MKARNYLSNKYVAGSLVLALSSIGGVIIQSSSYAAMSKVTVRFDRMAINQTTTGMICAQPNNTGTVSSVTVAFPNNFSVSSTTANWTTGTTNSAWPSGATAWPSIGSTASSVSGQSVTWSSANLTVGTLYCFNWTTANALTQPSTTGTSEIGSVITNIDATGGSYATSTVGANADQIAVTASVPPSFSFSLSANADALGSLSTGSVTSSATPRVATISTNAKNGWMAWAKDSNAGLSSALTSYTIGATNAGTNNTLTAGTEGYNTGIVGAQNGGNGGTGALTVATPFVGGATGKGTGLSQSYQTLATDTGTSSGSTLTITNNVAISPVTPAASDYSDTITVVGAGLF